MLELHGSVLRNYCERCHKFYDAQYMLNSEGIPRCSCGGMIKPDVVLYEEGLDSDTLNRAVRAIAKRMCSLSAEPLWRSTRRQG